MLHRQVQPSTAAAVMPSDAGVKWCSSDSRTRGFKIFNRLDRDSLWAVSNFLTGQFCESVLINSTRRHRKPLCFSPHQSHPWVCWVGGGFSALRGQSRRSVGVPGLGARLLPEGSRGLGFPRAFRGSCQRWQPRRGGPCACALWLCSCSSEHRRPWSCQSAWVIRRRRTAQMGAATAWGIYRWTSRPCALRSRPCLGAGVITRAHTPPAWFPHAIDTQ